MSTAELMAEARLKMAEIQAAEAVAPAEDVQDSFSIQATETDNLLGLTEYATADLHPEESSDVEAFAEPEFPIGQQVQIDPVGAFADQVASRLDLEMVDALAAHIRELELECGALRRIAANAVVAAREAVAMSAYAQPFEEVVEPKRRWKFWRFGR